ncbi:S-adenosyl-L-methionine-dependent methyltransferase [Trema orientale]|uniref:RNA methyltransferase n=1 Tax=Trema orientale TaxID=63057 RepID=A0A2P5FST1_TREOI|nr:S-adenosyl-L-methionine-dependent methyltransferase [Trema orientale]
MEAEKKKGEEKCTQKIEQKKKKRKDVFPYGNYKNYYGYRIGQDMEEDPRLKVMKKEWFEGKDCLDVGCNNGSITIQIAKKFQCQSIIGVDIDSNRIEDAYWHLRKFVKMEQGKASKSKVSENANGLGTNIAASSDIETKQTLRNCSSQEKDLSDIVSFRQENFVQSRHPPEKHYDTILCLSVTKWIHLNWGDDGLITLFSKIWRLLNPGGIFVLEPQPWKSYDNNRTVSETTAENFKKIIFRPECFQDLLLDKIGFRTVEDVASSLSGSKTGFNRPIFVFRK